VKKKTVMTVMRVKIVARKEKRRRRNSLIKRKED
jgi:hypothetical protein